MQIIHTFLQRDRERGKERECLVCWSHSWRDRVAYTSVASQAEEEGWSRCRARVTQIAPRASCSSFEAFPRQALHSPKGDKPCPTSAFTRRDGTLWTQHHLVVILPTQVSEEKVAGGATAGRCRREKVSLRVCAHLLPRIFLTCDDFRHLQRSVRNISLNAEFIFWASEISVSITEKFVSERKGQISIRTALVECWKCNPNWKSL